MMNKIFFKKMILNKKDNLSIKLNDLINIYVTCKIFEKDF